MRTPETPTPENVQRETPPTPSTEPASVPTSATEPSAPADTISESELALLGVSFPNGELNLATLLKDIDHADDLLSHLDERVDQLLKNIDEMMPAPKP
ncbi:hypothetical protein H4R33_003375 [Dimargaris cristalligena]|nr:hypothetical protein H4R33_003375 [Dimargaris cristalligena]